MKKIIVLILALSFVFALASCDGNNAVDNVGEMFIKSVPTKTVTSIAQVTGDVSLEAQYTLTTGLVNGKTASVLISEVDEMMSVGEAGSSDVIVGSIVTKTEKREYLEGKGVRVDGGTWNKKEENFADAAGPTSLNLSSDLIKDFEYTVNEEKGENTLRIVVRKDNTAEVFGLEEDLAVDVSCEITDDGAVITSVIIGYVLPADTEAQVEETEITIKCFYFYDIQIIDIK